MSPLECHARACPPIVMVPAKTRTADQVALPYLTAEVPGIGGVIRVAPEDFVVEERPLYLPSGQGEHLYLRITKRGLATPHLVAYLSSRLGLKAHRIGVAGLKDANAVSTQMVSLQGVTPDVVAKLSHESVLSVQVLGRHTNRLRPGHHAGNRFELMIRRVHPRAAEVAPLVLERLGRQGIPNYFGPQRQGRRGQNYLLGAELLRNGLRRARMPKHKRAWYVNAYQAHVFNLVLARRIDRLDRILNGDWAMKHDNGACFQVVHAEVEQPRAERFEISPTGPLFGSRAPWASAEAGAIEEAVVAGLGETPASLRDAAAACRVRGERRALRVRLQELDWVLADDSLRLCFTLPPGAYATSVLRELMKAGNGPAAP